VFEPGSWGRHRDECGMVVVGFEGNYEEESSVWSWVARWSFRASRIASISILESPEAEVCAITRSITAWRSGWPLPLAARGLLRSSG
jgi:hypothetical protein